METGEVASEGAYLRSEMQPAFGDVAWRLEKGETGVCLLNSVTSAYGWHIIRRIE